MIEIFLAGPPMGKERVRFVRATGRAFTPERTVNYEGRLALAAQQVMAGRPLLTGPVHVHMIAYVPIPESKSKRWKGEAIAGRERPTKKPDLDNLAKSAFDALNMVVWADDTQVVRATLEKWYSAQPGLEIRVSDLTTDDEGVLS